MRVAYFMWPFALIIIAFGVWQLAGCIAFYRRSVRTVGQIVAWEEPRIGDPGSLSWTGNGRAFRAVAAFAAADGREHRVRSRNVTRTQSGRPGSTGGSVAVRYDPKNPTDARIATLVDYWLFPAATVAIGVFLVLLALRQAP